MIMPEWDYRILLRRKLDDQGRGSRDRLSRFAKMQPAYLSMVLSGKHHFSLEQAERVAEFFEMKSAEKDFFLILVQIVRAGSDELREYFKLKLEELSKSVDVAQHGTTGRPVVFGYEFTTPIRSIVPFPENNLQLMREAATPA